MNCPRVSRGVAITSVPAALGCRGRGAEDAHARTDRDVILDHQVTGVEVRLRADPHPDPEPTAAACAALQISLRADEGAVADLEGLGVHEPDARVDADSVADADRQR